MVNKSCKLVRFVMQIRVLSGDKSYIQKSCLSGTGEGHICKWIFVLPLQREIYALLLDRKGKGTELTAFSSKQS